jgi:type I restriction enzyme, S subunit
LFYYFDAQYQKIRGLVGEARDGLSLDLIKHILIPLPPIAQQQAIADYLDKQTARIDQLYQRVEEAIECLQERRIALITEAVTGQIDVRSEVHAS